MSVQAAFTWLASFRLRLLFRLAFLLLAVAVLAMAVAVLQEEKQRSHDNYRQSFLKTKEQIAARLRHPTGQLALLNPPAEGVPLTPLHPVVLPYSAIDFDDQNKVQNAIEMAGCLVHYPNHASVCVAIGSNPWAGGFIYAAGTFASADLVAHRIGDQFLDQAHRLRVTVSLRGQTYRWIAPFEQNGDPALSRVEGARGRLTGFVDIGRDYSSARPVKDFRGWVWQRSECLQVRSEGNDCDKQSFFSVRLPVAVLRDALFQREKPVWPPADLHNIQVRIEVLAPGEEAALFDSNSAEASAPFSFDELKGLLLPGETLVLRKTATPDRVLLKLVNDEASPEESSALLNHLIRRLPVESYAAPIDAEEVIATPVGNYLLQLKGDARSVNRALSVVATRLQWFVGAMLGAIGLAWLVIEIGIIRRIARLTRRAASLSKTVKSASGLAQFELAELRGKDEMGILATALNDLLQRVKEDVEREKIRAEQERDRWHAVGHEIMSPLQSLLVLHGKPEDPASRYIHRMQQAVRILYGSASPSEAFEGSTLEVQTVDIDDFLVSVAANAASAGVADVRYTPHGQPVAVRADDYSLEDVVTHVLRNAERYRVPGTPITLTLETSETAATVCIHNCGPAIPEDMLDKIFEYGVSELADSAANGNRGQGLFVAKTYMAKMGGTIAARNAADGVSFMLTLMRG